MVCKKIPASDSQSARDLAFALDALSSAAIGPISGPAVAAPKRQRRGLILAAAGLAAVIAAFVLGRSAAPAPPPPPTISRLTFDRGVIRAGRFAPDSETIVYGASWNGAPLKIFAARADTGESKPLDLPTGDILSVSRYGRDAAVSCTPLQHVVDSRGHSRPGAATSGRAPARSSSACAMPTSCLAINWPSSAAWMGAIASKYPQGKVVFETTGYLSSLRVSPDGKRVGFIEHPLFGDNRGYISVYDGSKARRLTPQEHRGAESLAWSADGREILVQRRHERGRVAALGDRRRCRFSARRPPLSGLPAEPPAARHRPSRPRAPDRRRGQVTPP